MNIRPAWRTYDQLARTGGYGDSPAEGEPVGDAAREKDFLIGAIRGRRRVLDLGCGPGVAGLSLAPEVGLVVGLDASAAMLELAEGNRERLGVGNAVFVRALAEELPFRRRSSMPSPTSARCAVSTTPREFSPSWRGSRGREPSWPASRRTSGTSS